MFFRSLFRSVVRTPANAAQPTTGVTASPAAVRITSFVLDPATSVLRTNETVKFTAAATGDAAIKRYMFYGIRPNGTRFQIYEGANNTAEWVFTSLGQFTFYVKAYDKKRNAVQKSNKGILLGIDVGGTNIKLAVSADYSLHTEVFG